MCRVEGMSKMTPNEYIRKLQGERDLGEEAEDEILISTGKSDFTDEKFMECVYKKELGSDFETMNDGVAVGLVDFTEDSEYKRLQYLLKSKTRYKRLLKIQARARGEKGEKES